jgi:nitric oxide dioxygenase
LIGIEQKKLVQASFETILQGAEAFAALFYRRLFELDPDLRPLFKVALVQQERKLIDMLCVAVFGLDRLNRLLPALRLLGERHLNYGVKLEHYAIVREALLWALAERLAEEFTPELRSAWSAVYQLFSETMQQHSYTSYSGLPDKSGSYVN